MTLGNNTDMTDNASADVEKRLERKQESMEYIHKSELEALIEEWRENAEMYADSKKAREMRMCNKHAHELEDVINDG